MPRSGPHAPVTTSTSLYTRRRLAPHPPTLGAFHTSSRSHRVRLGGQTAPRLPCARVAATIPTCGLGLRLRRLSRPPRCRTGHGVSTRQRASPAISARPHVSDTLRTRGSRVTCMIRDLVEAEIRAVFWSLACMMLKQLRSNGVSYFVSMCISGLGLGLTP